MWTIYNNLRNIPPKDFPTTGEIKSTISEVLPALKTHVSFYAEMMKKAEASAVKVAAPVPLQGSPVTVLYPIVDVQPAGKVATWASACSNPTPKPKTRNIDKKIIDKNLFFIKK